MIDLLTAKQEARFQEDCKNYIAKERGSHDYSTRASNNTLRDAWLKGVAYGFEEGFKATPEIISNPPEETLKAFWENA